jgi:hypothetical protein
MPCIVYVALAVATVIIFGLAWWFMWMYELWKKG